MGMLRGSLDRVRGTIQYRYSRLRTPPRLSKGRLSRGCVVTCRWGRLVGNPRHTAKGMALQQKGRAEIALGRVRTRNRTLAM
jgi:hypothetical protein